MASFSHPTGAACEQVGEYDFAGQFQQRPAPLGGGIIKREWLQTYAEHELPGEFDYKLQSWDTAAKASELAHYSVCTTWGVAKEMIYLLDVCARKSTTPSSSAPRSRSALLSLGHAA